jgi:hypothetical protein
MSKHEFMRNTSTHCRRRSPHPGCSRSTGRRCNGSCRYMRCLDMGPMSRIRGNKNCSAHGLDATSETWPAPRADSTSTIMPTTVIARAVKADFMVNTCWGVFEGMGAGRGSLVQEGYSSCCFILESGGHFSPSCSLVNLGERCFRAWRSGC